jgi:hypothetical protein
MKKILKNSGVCTTSKDGIDHIARFREAPLSEIKFLTQREMIEIVLQARAQKLKKAS